MVMLSEHIAKLLKPDVSVTLLDIILKLPFNLL